MNLTAGPELYVYYKLRAEQAEAARAVFEAARGDAPARLLQRADGEGADAMLTWMEIYPPGLEALEARVAEALYPILPGPRHREKFAPLS